MHVAESQPIWCFVCKWCSAMWLDVTIPRCSFVFGQSRAKVSAGFTNVRRRRKVVMGLCATRILYTVLAIIKFNQQQKIKNRDLCTGKERKQLRRKCGSHHINMVVMLAQNVRRVLFFVHSTVLVVNSFPFPPVRKRIWYNNNYFLFKEDLMENKMLCG